MGVASARHRFIVNRNDLVEKLVQLREPCVLACYLASKTCTFRDRGVSACSLFKEWREHTLTRQVDKYGCNSPSTPLELFCLLRDREVHTKSRVVLELEVTSKVWYRQSLCPLS